MSTNNGAPPATLWAALLLPELALEQYAEPHTTSCTASIDTPDAAPVAIVHRKGSRRLLTACNSAARAAGLNTMKQHSSST